jgi:hypothetical protein
MHVDEETVPRGYHLLITPIPLDSVHPESGKLAIYDGRYTYCKRIKADPLPGGPGEQ